MCRDKLPEEQHIEFVYTPNCPDRIKDADWTGYVNMSISRVNNRMLLSSNDWHEADEVWWAILSFYPDILSHEDVHFTTTNNTYHETVQRAPGFAGFDAMFSETVRWGYYGSIKSRRGLPRHLTTDEQAEVLYPGSVDLRLLQRIYVRKPEHGDWIASLLDLLPKAHAVPIIHAPEVFQ